MDDHNPEKEVERMNPENAIDAGLLTVKSINTTINQLKIDIISTPSAQNIELVAQAHGFLFRCYLDIMEGLQRLARLVIAADDQSNEAIPQDLRRLASEILNTIEELKHARKGKEQLSLSTIEGDQKALRSTTPHSERESEQLSSLDIHEVYKTFLSLFPGKEQKANEFFNAVSHVNECLSFLFLRTL